jgi:apolipoprotein D and lipocalin family protein
MKYRTPLMVALVTGSVLAVAGCLSLSGSKRRPLETVKAVDLPRFMGDWRVIANIPTVIERGAHDAVESYELRPNGTIATTFTFRKGSFDGPVKVYRPTGYIHNHQTNAEWRMQFIWPLKAAYLILYLDDEYQTTIVGVPSRRYVWIMSRSSSIAEERYRELVAMLDEMGFDTSKLERVPQS